MKWFSVLAAAVLAVLPASAFAKEPTKTLAELDSALGQMLKDGHVPGASVAIIENGKLVFAKGYGYADVAKKIEATADTPFRAGSISKSFTSVAVMMLVEQKKLSLDDRLADFAPQVHFDNPWEKTSPLRLANLLEHTTGWPDIGTRVLDQSEPSWSTLRGVQFSSKDFISRWEPGRFTVYNNAGPAVAALALEKASGMEYSAFMRERVLKPLGMSHADFDLTPWLAAHIAKSYAPDGSVTPYQHIILKPAGSLNISARELSQMVKFYLFDGFVDHTRLLSPASIRRIESSQTNLASGDGFVEAYALGNAIFPDSGPTFRGHNGGIDSFTSVMGYNRRSNSGYVLMANGGEGVDFATPIAHAVQAYLTRDWKMTPAPTVKVSDAELARYAGYYRTITPPNSMLKPFTEIGIAHVTVDGGKLKVGPIVSAGSDFFPVAPHVFRRFDREDASLAFVEKDGEVYKLGAFNAQEKAPVWFVPLVAVTVLVILLGALTGLAMLIPWIVFAARGRLPGGILVRIMPLLAIAAMTAMIAMPAVVILGSGTSAWHSLAIVGPYSLTILVMSVLFPLLALGSLVLAVQASGGMRAVVRGYVIATSLALLVAATYFASAGWFAMRTWEM